jgi:hypothetical protein
MQFQFDQSLAVLRRPWSFFGEARITDASSVFKREISPASRVNFSPAFATKFRLCFAHVHIIPNFRGNPRKPGRPHTLICWWHLKEICTTLQRPNSQPLPLMKAVLTGSGGGESIFGTTE